jgi:hypothetical protein
LKGTKRSLFSISSQKPCFEMFETSTTEVRFPRFADLIRVLLDQALH